MNESTAQLTEEVQDVLHRCNLLWEDARFCIQFVKKGDNDQFWRRTFVRNIFVLFEASSYGLKRVSMHLSQTLKVDFSPAELAMLREERYVLGKEGNAITQSGNFQAFIPNLKFAFKSFAKACGLDISLNVSGIPLNHFAQLRNRITHPKSLSELTITDEEIQVSETVGRWFWNEISALLNEHIQSCLKAK